MAQLVQPMHVTSSTYTICVRTRSPVSSSRSTIVWDSTVCGSISSSRYIPKPVSLVTSLKVSNTSLSSSVSRLSSVATPNVDEMASLSNPHSCICLALSARSASIRLNSISSAEIEANVSSHASSPPSSSEAAADDDLLSLFSSSPEESNELQTDPSARLARVSSQSSSVENLSYVSSALIHVLRSSSSMVKSFLLSKYFAASTSLTLMPSLSSLPANSGLIRRETLI
mmetsp:Transcript_14869/g.31980  ORF Transcript_14869/g.31980 Transcript_14869/m.31980 type:complete len:228 (-) Transcript_14869:207-890(-)